MSEPAWKRDFPVAWVDDHLVTRREFTKSLACLSAAAFAATAALSTKAALSPSRRAFPAVKVAGVHELEVGAAKVFGYPEAGEPCILVRLAADRFVAFGQKCTHLGCPVFYRADERRLHCPCHEGYFDATDGAVLAGPPPRPLPQIVLERRGDELWAVGVRS